MKLFLLILFLAGCVAQTMDPGFPGHPDPTLKPQLKFAIDGVPCAGVCVAQRRTLAKITLSLPEKTTLVLVNTCARQDEFWNPDPKKVFEYAYSYAIFKESRGSCPMILTVVTSIGELHRGIIDWSNINSDPAKVGIMCNGRWFDRVGFDFCSIAAGLPVVVTSDVPAVLAHDPESDCPEPKGALREWEIETKKPEAGRPLFCVYVLINKNKQEFRLTTHAYSSILNVFPPKGGSK